MARKQRTGVVVSDVSDKTVVVVVERSLTHPLYHKVLRRRKKYQAHDQTNLAKLGDRVLIEECRPISRHKRWRVVEIVERREVAEIQPGEIAAPVLEEEGEAPAAPAAAPAATSADTPAVPAGEPGATPSDEEAADTPEAETPDEETSG